MKKGKLICIEGTDSSGKETQSKLLVEKLQKENIPCKTETFPRYETPTGRIIGQCYLGKDTKTYNWQGDTGWFPNASELDPKVASLYYASDRRAAKLEIEKILNDGANLILDRYSQSNMGHQGAKLKTPEERKDLFDWLERLEFGLLEIPKEDLTVFLYMPTKIAVELRKERSKKTRESADAHEANLNHLRQAEKTYLQLAENYCWKKIDCAPDGTIDSLKSPEEISEELYKLVKEIL